MNKKVLDVTDLNVFYDMRNSKWFQGKNKVQILHSINFCINEGEIMGLMGESGCGKSTLGKAVLGMVEDLTGKIYHETKMPQMVFQDPYGSLNPVKKIGWILEEPLRVKSGYQSTTARKQVISMLEKVGLDEKFAQRYPKELSGGQRQRICIALALMTNPGFIIADEPVSALDVTVQAQIIELLLKLHKELCISILFISHDLKVVYKMCDRVMVMKQGCIVEQGHTDAVYFEPKHEYTRELLQAAGIKK